MNGKGNVVVFTITEQANLKERLRGYRDALEASPQIKITRVVDMKGDSRVAFDTATESSATTRRNVRTRSSAWKHLPARKSLPC